MSYISLSHNETRQARFQSCKLCKPKAHKTDSLLFIFHVDLMKKYLYNTIKSKLILISQTATIDVQIQDYFAHLIGERQAAWSTCNVRFNGIKSFYKGVLDRDINAVIPPRPRQKQLPCVLSQKDVWKLINSCDNMKHRTILLCAYSGGLRVSDVVVLKPEHIDSHRMTIRVEQGKGRKDRETILSEVFFTELKAYWRAYRPETWLFYGRDKSKPIPIESAQKN
jgi:integrase